MWNANSEGLYIFYTCKKANEGLLDLLRIKPKNVSSFRERIVTGSEQDFGNPPVTTELHWQYKTSKTS